MPDPTLEQLASQAGVEVPQSPAGSSPEITSTPSDPWSVVRQKFEGLPDDVTLDTFADHFYTLQEQADKAAEYQAKIAEYEARLAAQARQVVPEKPATPAAPAEDELLVDKPVSFDRALVNLCKQDPESGVFVPKNPGSLAHIQAADELNRYVQYRNELETQFYTAPQEFIEKRTKRQIAAIEAKMQAEIDTLKQLFAPVQEQVTRSQAERQMYEFTEKNADKLYGEDGQLTQIGLAVNEFIGQGVSPEKALLSAEKIFNTQTPAVAPQKITISKAAARPSNRFIDGVSPSTRDLLEKPDAGVGSGKRAPTMADLKREFEINGR